MSPITTEDPQVARLVERVEHIARAIDNLTPLVVHMSQLQKDQERNSDEIRRLNQISDARGDSVHRIDKRVLVLERWHKFVISITGILIATSIGYISNFSDFKEDTRQRISSLEFIINSPHFERAMDNDSRPVAEGGKD